MTDQVTRDAVAGEPGASLNAMKFRSRIGAADHITRKWGIKCSPKTLAKRAVEGDGPVYRKFGNAVLYTTEDLDAWVLERMGEPQRTTSDRMVAA